MIVAELRLAGGFLSQTASEAPGVVGEWVQTDATDEGMRLVVRVATERFDAFERALDRDPDAASWERLTDDGDRRLYSIGFSDGAVERSIYDQLLETGGIIRRARLDEQGWDLTIEFPSQCAVTSFREFCEETGQRIDLYRIHRTGDAGGDDRDFGLTEKQREMLRAAVEQGYFRVPRETDLNAIADELGISHQAASERLRRSTDQVMRRVLRYDSDGPDEDDEGDGNRPLTAVE